MCGILVLIVVFALSMASSQKIEVKYKPLYDEDTKSDGKIKAIYQENPNLPPIKDKGQFIGPLTASPNQEVRLKYVTFSYKNIHFSFAAFFSKR